MSPRKSFAAHAPRVTGHPRSDFGLWLFDTARGLGILSDRQLAVRLAQLRVAEEVREGDQALRRAKARVARLMRQAAPPKNSEPLWVELQTIGIDCSRYAPIWIRTDTPVLCEDGQLAEVLIRDSDKRLEFGEPPTLGIGELKWWARSGVPTTYYALVPATVRRGAKSSSR
jgi:hypothetical protein